MREGVFFGGCLALSTALHCAAIAGFMPSQGEQNGIGVIEVSIHPSDQFAPSGQAAAPQLAQKLLRSSPIEPQLVPIKRAEIREKPKQKLAKTTTLSAPSSTQNITPQESAAGSGAGKLGGGAGGSSGVVQVIFAPRPPYPWAARVAGFEGALTLDVLIGEDGYVKSANIVQSSGRDDCDQAALKTIRDRWRFRPMERDGTPVECKERVVVRYALK